MSDRDPAIFIRLWNSQFASGSDDDLRALSSIVRVPGWFTESQKLKDASAQIEKYFLAIGEEISIREVEGRLTKLGIKSWRS